MILARNLLLAMAVAGLTAACAQLPDNRGQAAGPPALSALPVINLGLGYDIGDGDVGVGVGTGIYAGPVRLDLGAWY